MMFDPKERTIFYDALMSWTNQLNRGLFPSASSSEVMEAYSQLINSNCNTFRPGNNFSKTFSPDELDILKEKIVW